MYLLDTNILLRSISSGHPDQQSALNAVANLLGQGQQMCIMPQNIAEFWNVCTRPIENNGFGLNTKQVRSEVTRIEALLTLKPDSPALYEKWKDLVIHYNVRGAKVHDTRLVAAMLMHGLTHILTFNTRDFQRFSEITAVHPESVSGL